MGGGTFAHPVFVLDVAISFKSPESSLVISGRSRPKARSCAYLAIAGGKGADAMRQDAWVRGARVMRFNIPIHMHLWPHIYIFLFTCALRFQFPHAASQKAQGSFAARWKKKQDHTHQFSVTLAQLKGTQLATIAASSAEQADGRTTL
eukprot:1145528-Pelagomonas_calceolata.AAC.3